MTSQLLLLVFLAAAPLSAAKKPKAVKTPPALDQFIEQATGRPPAPAAAPSPGSLWLDSGRLADFARDSRASRVDDILTIQVLEKVSATATGTVKTSRASSVKASVDALAGVTKATSPWANLAATNANMSLDGQGTTARGTVVSTYLTARVVAVLPNGLLAIQGDKTVQVNGEAQTVIVRGVVRPADIAPANTVTSNQIAQLEVRVNGKGVIGDAVRRPFILYRILLGLLPF